jgi:hypothetical protein
MKLLLKRHPPIDPQTGRIASNVTKDQEEAFPHPDQLDVGELAINTITGKLYTKLLDGSVVEFLSQKICFDPVPQINFFYENAVISAPDFLIENFCCSGGLLTVVVNDLRPEPTVYNFYLEELTNNTNKEFIQIQPVSYSVYTKKIEQEDVQFRQATIPISLKLLENNFNNISLFQFKITDQNERPIRGSERTITVRCIERE